MNPTISMAEKSEKYFSEGGFGYRDCCDSGVNTAAFGFRQELFRGKLAPYRLDWRAEKFGKSSKRRVM
jgi:hypothetical protein